MTIKEYFAAPGLLNCSHADVQVIGTEITKLAQTGASSAADILAAATPKTAPLHPYFEWSNAKAAESYRLWQARSLAQHIQVSVVMADGTERKLRAFYANAQEDKAQPFTKGLKHYISIEQVRERPDYRLEVIAEAKRQLLSWRARHAEYEEIFQPIFEAIDALDQQQVAA